MPRPHTGQLSDIGVAPARTDKSAEVALLNAPMTAQIVKRLLRVDPIGTNWTRYPDGHELRLGPQAAQQLARGGDSNQSKHDGNADEQMRIHEFLFVR